MEQLIFNEIGPVLSECSKTGPGLLLEIDQKIKERTESPFFRGSIHASSDTLDKGETTEIYTNLIAKVSRNRELSFSARSYVRALLSDDVTYAEECGQERAAEIYSDLLSPYVTVAREKAPSHNAGRKGGIKKHV